MKKNILYLSPSSLNLYLTCPLLYKNKKVDVREQQDLLNFGRWIHDCAKIYLKNNKKRDIFNIAKSNFTKYNIGVDEFMDGKEVLKRFIKREYLQYKILCCETEFKDILPNGIALAGRIDLIVERDKDTIEIVDYKSGWKYYSVSSLSYNNQLKIYKMLVKSDEKYKKYKNVILTIDPLRYEPVSVSQDEFDEGFLDWLAGMYLKITTDKKFEPYFPNTFCKTCHITDLCDGYKKLLKYNFKIKQSIKERARHFFEIQKIKPIIENDLEFYKEFFKDYISKQKENQVEIGNYKLSVNENKRLFIKRTK